MATTDHRGSRCQIVGLSPSGAVRLVDRLVAASGLANVRVLEAGDEITLGECLNLAVRVSTGEVLAKMDDDDL